jgi:two-component system phosphate regulon response regulator PhoB
MTGIKGRILVVDDQAYIRRLVRFVLERAGYEVMAAGTAEDALKLLKESHPDVVTVDLMMPGRSGLDLLAEKQADPEIRSIPALVVTAVGLRADIQQAQELGAQKTLAKPFSHRQLLDAVDSLLIHDDLD